MGETLLLQNGLLSTVMCLFVYVLDYLLAHYEAVEYRSKGSRFIKILGVYEDTPSFDAAGKSQLLNMRILAILLMLAGGVYGLWLLTFEVYNQPLIFKILLGGIILLKVAGMARRWRYISLFRYLGKEGGVEEEPTFSRRLYLTLWYNELYMFSAVYLLAYLVTGSGFFGGGALTCFIAARRWRDYTIISKFSPG
jgi:hypothetical protein